MIPSGIFFMKGNVMYRIGHWVLAFLLYAILTFVFAKLGVFSVLIAFQKGVLKGLLLLALVVIAGFMIARLWQRIFGQKNNPSIKDRPHA